MRKTIWACWLQGEEHAPPLVRACLSSWRRNNPGWEVRCLDATTIERYVPVRGYVDLEQQSVTAASLSDILRILLPREFGGVWADATLLCNRPLDDWLPGVMDAGFFAFTAAGRDRVLSSWFLATTTPNHYLVSQWHKRSVDYWRGRQCSDDYFWFHHQFRDLCETDRLAAEAWSRVPKHSADGPHALQRGGRLYRPAHEVMDSIDWRTPVFKLTHHVEKERLTPGCLLANVLSREEPLLPVPVTQERTPPVLSGMASLKVSSENLGDHIQIISALRLLSRLGVNPTRYIDRDDEIRSAPELDAEEGPVGIVLNGWFKTNCAEWPPHPKLAPLIFGFHIRLFQCPELVSDASIAFFRHHEPIGCRDVYTASLLRSKGVDAFTSHCLSLTLPRRRDDAATQTDLFVVSRDERIKDYLPSRIGPYSFINHYSGSTDFTANIAQAQEFL